jgi:hypothetical protein
VDYARPEPTVENWAWLGQRLVIPVGQEWPWLSADQVHLRQPLVAPSDDPLLLDRLDGLLRASRGFVVRRERHDASLVEVHRHRAGHEWEVSGVKWRLAHVAGQDNLARQVLMRNGQPLAAMQRQGKLLNTWTEFIYDDQGYSFVSPREDGLACPLTNGSGEVVLVAHLGETPRIELRRALPLPFLAMVCAYVMEKSALLDVGARAIP